MKKTLIMALSAIVLWSCNNTPENSISNSNQETIEHEDHHDNESSETIELNDGERWLVNDEMKPFVSKGEELLNAYAQTDEIGHKELASQLQEQNDKLIKSCTMTGKSHDELHKWLSPHMGLLSDLSKTESKEEADRLVSDINTSFQTYHHYFQ